MPSIKSRIHPQGDENNADHKILEKPQGIGARSVTDTTSHTVTSSHSSSPSSGSGGGGEKNIGSSPNENKVPTVVVQAAAASRGTIGPPSSAGAGAFRRTMENTVPAEGAANKGTPPKHSKRHSNRRSNSDIPISVQQGFAFSPAYGAMAPPPPPPPYAAQSYGGPVPTGPSPFGLPGNPHQQRYYSPRLVAGGSPSGTPPAPPPPPPAGRGTPPLAHLRQHARSYGANVGDGEKKPLLDESNKSERRLRSSRRYHGGHRKSKSSSAATPGAYGAFWSGQQDELQQQSASFSPRNEFRKLAHGLSPTSSSSRKLASSQFSASMRFDPGAEIDFFRQHRHKTESSHRMHMRQRSAQLFMQDTKGVEQEPSCRNVVFLLIFVFHLMFVGYLGGVFGGKALEYHDKSEAEVTIFYKNLVMIAVWSGAFAIGVSGLLLGAMSIFARHFVKVALIVIITLSFMWVSHYVICAAAKCVSKWSLDQSHYCIFLPGHDWYRLESKNCRAGHWNHCLGFGSVLYVHCLG